MVPARRDQRRAGCSEHGVTIWDEWADAGRRARPGLRRAVAVAGRRPDGQHIDQITQVLETLRTRPGLAAHHRLGLERRRDPADGAARRATRSSSSTSPTAGSPASCTSAAPTCSSACRSTSPATRCSPTWSPQQVGLERRRLHLDRRRLPHLRQPRRAGPRAAHPRRRYPFPTLELQQARRRCSTTLTRTSRSSTTGTTPRSGPRSRSEVIGLIWAQTAHGRDRPRRRHPVAPAGGPGALQAATAGSAVVMGRRTWESLPAAVPAAAGPARTSSSPVSRSGPPPGAEKAPRTTPPSTSPPSTSRAKPHG